MLNTYVVTCNQRPCEQMHLLQHARKNSLISESITGLAQLFLIPAMQNLHPYPYDHNLADVLAAIHAIHFIYVIHSIHVPVTRLPDPIMAP